VAVKWFALRAGVEKTRGKTRREDLRGGWWGGVKLIVCSAFVGRIIQDVIKIKSRAEGQLACVSTGACTARGGAVWRTGSTRSALAAEMASLGRASDVNTYPYLDSDRASTWTNSSFAILYIGK
jgi:hypothetical protein